MLRWECTRLFLVRAGYLADTSLSPCPVHGAELPRPPTMRVAVHAMVPPLKQLIPILLLCSYSGADFSTYPPSALLVQCSQVELLWTEEPPIRLWVAPNREVKPGDPTLETIGPVNSGSFQWVVDLPVGLNVSFTYIRLADPLTLFVSSQEYTVVAGDNSGCLPSRSSSYSRYSESTTIQQASPVQSTARTTQQTSSTASSTTAPSASSGQSTASETIVVVASTDASGTASHSYSELGTTVSQEILRSPTSTNATTETTISSTTAAHTGLAGSTIGVIVGTVGGLILLFSTLMLLLLRRKRNNHSGHPTTSNEGGSEHPGHPIGTTPNLETSVHPSKTDIGPNDTISLHRDAPSDSQSVNPSAVSSYESDNTSIGVGSRNLETQFAMLHAEVARLREERRVIDLIPFEAPPQYEDER
ncbi:hypothetical protein C8Q80DRAFT_1145035 [Daedaleopsis nitida]|nr:hypothetical protein C8Q80DRAFT_1145035 [Daedaleopsis nitida]